MAALCGRHGRSDYPCPSKEMATTRSDNHTDPACAEAVRTLPPEKQAAWVGFLRTHALITKALDADLIANFGVPLSAFEVLLRTASSENGYLRMSHLAEEAMLSPSRISRLVTELQRRGLMDRRPCSTDTRVVYAAITDEGRALLDRVLELHLEGVERRFFSRLSGEQISQLAELWPRVLEAVAGASDAR
jgi:DNA-binding MarR family transcriptional regulator